MAQIRRLAQVARTWRGSLSRELRRQDATRLSSKSSQRDVTGAGLIGLHNAPHLDIHTSRSQ